MTKALPIPDCSSISDGNLPAPVHADLATDAQYVSDRHEANAPHTVYVTCRYRNAARGAAAQAIEQYRSVTDYDPSCDRPSFTVWA